MAHSNLEHRRTHNLLLIAKLLTPRDLASPFTLIQDTLEQPAKPLLREYLRRAKIARTASISLSFETAAKPEDVDFIIECAGDAKDPKWISIELAKVVAKIGSGKRILIVIDSLATLVAMSTDSRSNLNLTAYLMSLLQPPPRLQSHDATPPPHVSLVAVYHTDVPLPPCSGPTQPYSPPPLSLLSYLATTIITVHSILILVSAKAAQEKSLATPVFGLAEEVEGVVVGLKPKVATLKPDDRGIVLELEHRRKSGRGVLEWYFLPTTTKLPSAQQQGFREPVILLDDHPLFRPPKDEGKSEDELAGMTFELGLTDRQRLERDGVVLPYFDAQKPGGGTGGRILYDMGEEDDFDEEEDEI